jgi:lipoprotein-releasing system ATP-binding protein
MSDQTVVSCKAVSQSFSQGDLKVDVLECIDFDVATGERVAIVGASGSGKSTLLHLLGGLESPTSGMIKVNGVDLASLSEKNKGLFRNRHIGFIYQFHHLLPEFTAQENISMPLRIQGMATKLAMQQSAEILQQVGLENRLLHKPAELSGGERQRAAIARALITQPSCILADEPTGNLDWKNADQVYELMLSLNETQKTSFIIVTHDQKLASRMDRVLTIEHGKMNTMR